MTREEAIKWIRLDIEMTKFDPSTGEDAYLNDDAKKVIEAQEMAIKALEQPEQRWVSPKERLPEERQRVLVTIYTKRKGAQVRSGTYYDGYFNNDNGDCWKYTDKEVRAWAPLPEPYIEGGEDGK